MRHAVLSLIALCLMVGCKQQAEQSPHTEAPGGSALVPVQTPALPSLSPAATPSAAASAVAAGGARAVSEKTANYLFDYGYPAQAAAIPKLRAELEADLVKQRALIAQSAREGKAEARESGIPFNPHDRSLTWQVVTDLPGWLSLSGTYGAYSGGAHPNHWFGALLWDKAAATRRKPTDLFTSEKALSALIRADFCAEIDKQRAEKRGAPIVRDSDDGFSECIDPVEHTILLGSSNHQRFNRIGVLVAPYEAGPYVEGSYEVTLPVTAAVLAQVRPQFRSSFAAAR